jgi:hypothetical protein
MSKNYKVVDVQERTMINKRGGIEKIYRVTADSAAGTTFSVEVPESEFNKEKVDQVLTDKATLLDGIRKL